VRSPFLETTQVNGIRIEPYAEQFDTPHITEFVHRGYASLLAQGLRFVATHQDDATTLRRVSHGQSFLAIRDTDLVGIIGCYGPHPGDCDTYSHHDTAKFGHFAVDPVLRRSGIGSLLLQRVEDYARSTGFDHMALDTAEPATDLIQYYAKRGYEIVERVRWKEVNYSSVIMRKKLG
jgi:GNAT superfamily N-acetyltransferase